MSQDTVILAVRVRAEMAEIGQIVERSQRLLTKAIEHDDEDYYDGVAFNLHSFYTGIERILEEIPEPLMGRFPQAAIGIETCCCKWRLQFRTFVPPSFNVAPAIA